MGKMKGNRLNTAANVGTFVTSRQQLKAQQQMLQVQQEMLDLQRRQANAAEQQRLEAFAQGEVAAGRMTPEQGQQYVDLEMLNLNLPAPLPKTRIAPNNLLAIEYKFLPPSLGPGWFVAETGTARYWDGQRWTLQVLSLGQAQALVAAEWEASAVSSPGPAKSRVTAGVLAIALLGMLGIHRFYLGYKALGVASIVLVVASMFTAGLALIPAFAWGLIDGVLILNGKRPYDRDARGVPLA